MQTDTVLTAQEMRALRGPLSMAVAAKKSGISASYWRKLEGGKRQILPRISNSIRAAFAQAGEPVTILIGEHPAPQPRQPRQPRQISDEEAFVSTPEAKVNTTIASLESLLVQLGGKIPPEQLEVGLEDRAV